MNERNPPVVLLLPEPEHVIEALLERLDVPVEHGGVRRQPEFVRRAVHLQPTLCAYLGPRDALAHAVGEDLGPTTRQRHQASGLELLQDFAVVEAWPRDLREVVDLGGRPGLDLRSRVALG
ncbi:MAG TPA: hypothetical protein PLT07_02615 [Trueperaceae bacterium]|nr:hypothetical protein [Trueperaceae bacterium]